MDLILRNKVRYVKLYESVKYTFFDFIDEII